MHKKCSGLGCENMADQCHQVAHGNSQGVFAHSLNKTVCSEILALVLVVLVEQMQLKMTMIGNSVSMAITMSPGIQGILMLAERNE